MGCQPDFVMVKTTVGDAEDATTLARQIIEKRLAACVQNAPIRSTYRWDGTIESSEEILLTAKTRGDLATALMDFIRECHTYDVPELIVLPILDGDQRYLEWLSCETGPIEGGT